MSSHPLSQQPKEAGGKGKHQVRALGLKKTVVLVEVTPVTWRNWPCRPVLALGTLHWLPKGIWSSRPRQSFTNSFPVAALGE